MRIAAAVLLPIALLASAVSSAACELVRARFEISFADSEISPEAAVCSVAAVAIR